jgi:hypothetical protein
LTPNPPYGDALLQAFGSLEMRFTDRGTSPATVGTFAGYSSRSVNDVKQPSNRDYDDKLEPDRSREKRNY